MPYLHEPCPRDHDDVPYDDPMYVCVPFPHDSDATADELDAWFDEFVTGGFYATLFEKGERLFRIYEGDSRPTLGAQLIFMAKSGSDPRLFFKEREDAVRFRLKWAGRFPNE